MRRKNEKPDTSELLTPFTDEELNKLWKTASDPSAELLLILCYSGLRISELQNLHVDLDNMYFRCNSPKTGKERIVPIHTKIQPLVKARIERQGTLFDNKLQISNRSIHNCRHTFVVLCEKSGVKNDCKNQLLGHALSSDLYPPELLRTEIEKI